MKDKAYIVDIDGTLANGSHRHHLIKTKPKNWPAYRKLAHLDTPIWPVINTIKALAKNHPVFFVSGRMESEREVTTNWLKTVAGFEWDIDDSLLMMRPSNDSREDSIIKREIYHNRIKPFYEVICVFDDRPRVIRAWRAEGLFVFNVDQRAYGPEF